MWSGKKRAMKNKIRKAAALLLIFSGIFLAGYPWISNWLYGRTVASEVKVYEQQMKAADTVDTERQWSLARQYNKVLAESVVALTDPFVATEEMEGASLQEQYETTLCINEDGLMCFVEIPKIQVYLPVYHGTSERVLKRGAGHLQSSALSVGERGCRPVISAHSGISNSKMFSDLTELEKGDVFFLHVLDQVFSYRVCDIQVIWPDETEQLLPRKDRDLVSLLTCTPYGVNTQRLVVTGERDETDVTGLAEDRDHGAAGMPEVLESEWMKNYRRALEAGFAIIAGTIVCHLVMQKRRKMLRIHIAERGGNVGNEDRDE